MPDQHMLLPFLAKLESHASFSEEERRLVLSLPYTIVDYPAGRHLFREGDRATTCSIILSGYACRHKVLADGSRQILAIHVRGDGLDLQNAVMVLVDHNIQALSEVRAALVPAEAISQLAGESWAVARAMWIETLIEASIQREWTVNVGRRDARGRIAHLICEIGMRNEAAGLADRNCFTLPVTQEQLADATGLTSVHVNRVLQALGAEGLMERDRRLLKIKDWSRLSEVAGFDAGYLHPVQSQMAN